MKLNKENKLEVSLQISYIKFYIFPKQSNIKFKFVFLTK